MSKEKTRLMTPEFRVNWPQVFQPGKDKETGEETGFSVMALFPKGTDLSAMIKEIEKAAAGKWGSDKKKWPKLHPTLRDQAEKEKDGVLAEEYTPGAFFAAATSLILKVACACGERTTKAAACPGRLMSSV